MKKLLLVLMVVGVGVGGFLIYKSSLSSARPFDSELLYFVPESTTGITVCNSGMRRLEEYWSSKTMKELKALLTDNARMAGLVSPFLTENQRAEMTPVLDKVVKVIKAVLDSNLIKLGFRIEEYVQYQYADPKSPIPVSMAFANLTEEMEFKSDFDALKAAGLPVSEETGDGFTYYVIDYGQTIEVLAKSMPQPSPNPFPFSMKMYVASKGRKLGIGTDKDVIAKFFRGEKFSNKPKVLEDPNFLEAEKRIGFNGPRDFCQSYMDFKAMLKASVGAGIEAAGTSTQSPEMEKIFDSFPVTAIMQTAGYDKSISLTQQWTIKESVMPEDAKVWLSALGGNAHYEGLESLPESAALAIAINGTILNKLKEAAEKSPQVSPWVKDIPYLDIATSLNNFSFGVLPPSPGVIWPEGILALKLEKAKELHELAKNQITTQLSASGMGGFKWQEKDISGVKTSYFNTPFGVGLYLGQKGDTFVSTGSEAGLASFVSSDGKTMKEKLSLLGMERLNDGLAETYMSFPALLSLGRGVQASLAMFMPANIQISKDFDIIANAIGEYYVGVGLTPGYFKIKVNQKTVN